MTPKSQPPGEAPLAVWTISAARTRTRLRIAAPAVLTFAATAIFADAAWEALFIVGAAATIAVAALAYSFLAKDLTYELGRWTDYAGYQTHAEATGRRQASVARNASDALGETFILEPKSQWRLGTSLPTTRECEEEVRRTLATALPHRPGRRVNALTMAVALGITVAIFAGLLLARL